MGELQPDGLVRDWATSGADSDDDDLSMLGEQSDDDLSDFDEEEEAAAE